MINTEPMINTNRSIKRIKVKFDCERSSELVPDSVKEVKSELSLFTLSLYNSSFGTIFFSLSLVRFTLRFLIFSIPPFKNFVTIKKSDTIKRKNVIATMRFLYSNVVCGMNGSLNERITIQIKGAAQKRHMKITETANKPFLNINLMRINFIFDSENSFNLTFESGIEVKSGSYSISIRLDDNSVDFSFFFIEDLSFPFLVVFFSLFENFKISNANPIITRNSIMATTEARPYS